MGRIVGGASGLSSGLVGGKSYQRFTASGDWIKPAGASFITFEMIGAGGGGGGSYNWEAGGGGGGGACYRNTFPASAIPNFLSVVVRDRRWRNGWAKESNRLRWRRRGWWKLHSIRWNFYPYCLWWWGWWPWHK